MSWKEYETEEIISDDEFEEVCTECRCFNSEGKILMPCNGERCDCYFFGKIDD